MRSVQTTHNLIAVSALLRETAINVEQTLDTGMLCDRSSMPVWEPKKESNADEATGKEEPDTLYDLGADLNFGMEFGKMQAQHFGLIASYGLGVSTPAAAGTGHRHTIIPIDGDLDAARSNPSLSLGFRAGKRLVTDLYASLFVDTFTLSFSRSRSTCPSIRFLSPSTPFPSPTV